MDPADVDILMGTFTKSFGGMGGYIAGGFLGSYMCSYRCIYICVCVCLCGSVGGGGLAVCVYYV